MASNGQNSNRLQLNFSQNDPNRTQQFGADYGRQFPTTPSTFPQPVFSNQQGQQEVWGTQHTGNGYGNAGYFMSNPYQPQYAQQSSNLATPGGSAFGAASARQQQYNDGTNGLVHQFSHQNLGGTPRSGSPYGRQPSPAQPRPRTAGSTPQQSTYNSFLAPPIPPSSSSSSQVDETPRDKNSELYSDNVAKKAKISATLVTAFFKDAVQRARDRNGRSVVMMERSFMGANANNWAERLSWSST